VFNLALNMCCIYDDDDDDYRLPSWTILKHHVEFCYVFGFLELAALSNYQA
jgi:hypothetical protein